MKLISLNIWGGHLRAPLLEFIKAHQEVDIFCFQEVYHQAKNKISTEDREVSLNIFSELQNLLPTHRGFFRPVVDNIYGIGAFVRDSIHVLQEGDAPIHINPNYIGRGPTHSRNLQWLKCQIKQQTYSIINVHGLWNGCGKTDSPERLMQSQKIRQFIDSINNPMVICGDFNLRPDTESLSIIAQGLNNLIESHQINSTRTSLYPKPEKFADYILTSPDIVIESFQVLQHEVSDHAPLMIDFK